MLLYGKPLTQEREIKLKEQVKISFADKPVYVAILFF